MFPSYACTNGLISCAASSLPPPGLLPSTNFFYLAPRRHHFFTKKAFQKWKHHKGLRGRCRADLSQDAPFAAAIGACILNSLVFPAPSGSEGGESSGVMGSEDLRFGVMGVISFLPYFNWLSWVFAWLDTGRQRYLVYTIVYLAPYLRTNLSLSPEDSWLPVTSILLCIVHVQLEAESRAGDSDITPIRLASEFLKGITKSGSSLPLVNEFLKLFSKGGIKNVPPQERVRSSRNKEKGSEKLSHAKDESKDRLGDWNNPQKPGDEPWVKRNEDEESKSD